MWLELYKLVLKSVETEEFLIFAAQCDDCKPLAAEVGRKLLSLPGQVEPVLESSCDRLTTDMIEVNVTEAQTTLTQLLERVEQGEEVVITRQVKAIAVLSSHTNRLEQFISHTGLRAAKKKLEISNLKHPQLIRQEARSIALISYVSDEEMQEIQEQIGSPKANKNNDFVTMSDWLKF